MPSQTERFEEIRVKIDRAETLLASIRDLDDDFRIVECSLKPKEKDGVSFYSMELPEPPLGISGLVGDCIGNLRSSLDHVVWMIVDSNDLSEPSRSNMFPICKSKQDFERQLEGKRLNGVPQEAIDQISRIQPYEVLDQDLLLLNSLCVKDKHRHLLYTVSVASDVELMWYRNGQHVLTTFVGNDEIRSGDIFGGVGVDSKFMEGIEMSVLGKANAFIAFRDEREAEDQSLPVAKTLYRLCNHVKYEVVDYLWEYVQ